MGLHQLLLLGLESALEVPLERRFFGGSEEKGIGAGKVERGHEEADGLHHIPTQFPEGEPHEAQCLENQEAQPAVEFSLDQSLGFLVDYALLLLHLL